MPCIVLAVAALRAWPQPGSAWLLAGSVLYIVDTILVTMVSNVPLNNALAAADPERATGARVWADYLRRWMRWNHVRTAAALGAAAAFIMALAG